MRTLEPINNAFPEMRPAVIKFDSLWSTAHVMLVSTLRLIPRMWFRVMVSTRGANFGTLSQDLT